jgi:uncharacterized membrane protein
MTDMSESPRRLLFRAHLKPYRSLSMRHFRLMMLLVIVACLTISTFALLAGAWPVFGFMVLEIALIYVLFRISYRRARVSELLELDERALTVECTDPKGRSRSWQLQPAWLKVELDEPILPQTPVVLRSHGKSLPIGVFLHPKQRRAVAKDLRNALDRWRRPGPLFE